MHAIYDGHKTNIEQIWFTHIVSNWDNPGTPSWPSSMPITMTPGTHDGPVLWNLTRSCIKTLLYQQGQELGGGGLEITSYDMRENVRLVGMGKKIMHDVITKTRGQFNWRNWINMEHITHDWMSYPKVSAFGGLPESYTLLMVPIQDCRV